jgi:hypothetical protein
MCHSGHSSGFGGSPAEDKSTLGLPQGFLPGPDIWYRSPFHSTSLRARSAAPQPPSVVWKEALELHPGCTLSGSRDPHRLQSPGAGTRWSDLTGASNTLQEECWTSENKTQTQVVGGKDLLH